MRLCVSINVHRSKREQRVEQMKTVGHNLKGIVKDDGDKTERNEKVQRFSMCVVNDCNSLKAKFMTSCQSQSLIFRTQMQKVAFLV